MRVNNRVLFTLIFAYLSLPLEIFLFGWLRIEYALIVTVVVVWCGYHCFRESGYTELTRAQARTLAAAVVLLIAVLALSGVGSMGYQNGDWSKHNAVMHDLINRAWPVKYTNDTVAGTTYRSTLLDYYMAWYLPPAAVGKLLGWNAANIAQFVWTALGLSLFAVMLVCLTKVARARYLFAFIFFGGLDIVGIVLVNHTFPGGTDSLEHWYPVIEYTPMLTGLFWVPQHTLGAWLGTGFILMLAQRKSKYVPLAISPCLLWTPLVFLGLLPFAGYAVIRSGIRRSLNAINIIGSSVLLVMPALFLRMDHNAGTFHFLWQVIPLAQWWTSLAVWYFLEFILYVLVIRDKYREEKSYLFYLTVAALCLWPFLNMGIEDDLAMRGAMPALLVLALFVMRYLSENGRYKNALIALLVCSSFTGLTDIVRSLNAYGHVTDWHTLLKPASDTSGWKDQYKATDYQLSFFAKHLMR